MTEQPSEDRRPGAQPIEEIAFEPARSAGDASRRHRIVFGALGGAVLLVLGTALWFVFTARSVQIAIEPPPDAVSFESAGLQFRLEDRYLTRPGTATVRAVLEGYYPLEETVVIGSDESQVFNFTMQKTPGRLTFAFDDKVRDPRIVIDDETVWEETTGMLEAGSHRLRIEAPRYQLYNGEIEIEGGGVEQVFAPELVPNWADVYFETTPAGVEVLVDDEVLGTAPGNVEILAGDHIVTLRAPGYKDWVRPLRAVANEPQSFTGIELAKADGLLTVRSSPAGASVAVNGRYRGLTPLELRLPPGKRYQLRVSKAGFTTGERAVNVRSDQDLSLRFDLEEQYGQLRFDIQPAEAVVYVNGDAAPLADGVLSLPAVAQDIEVVAPGYVSFREAITPNPAYARDVKVRLLTIEAAREAAIPKTLTTAAGQKLIFMRPEPFVMGASRRERGRRANEVLRDVESLAEFYISEKEVTNREFRQFLRQHDSGSVYRVDLNGPEHPVVNVTWEQAAQYCNWLSEKDGLTPAYVKSGSSWRSTDSNGYRLPSEAQWAWAARFAAGQGAPRFPWGSSLPPATDSGNFADRSAVGLTSRTLREYNDGYAATAPVGSFAATPAGLFDIGGNVSEWTDDEYTVGASVVADNGEATFRVIRGSSWMHSDISELRLTFRDFSDVQRSDVGFRLVRPLEEPVL